MILCEINSDLVNLITICIVGGITLIAIILTFIIVVKHMNTDKKIKKLEDEEKVKNNTK